MHFKTELCDGEVHMTAKDFVEHCNQENRLKLRNRLKKVANNPILDKDVRDAVWAAIYLIDDNNSWRKKYIELKEKL